MKLIKLIDIIVLIVISVVAITIVTLDFFDFWPASGSTFEVNYPLLGVLFLALIGMHLGAAHLEITKDHDKSKVKLDQIYTRVGNSLVHVFTNSVELEEYLAKRIREAKIEICDLSWKARISAGFAVGKRKESHKNYEASISAASKAILYREIFIFNDPRRVEKMKRRIAEDRDGYSCRYFAYSEPLRPLIPIDSGHPFRSNPAGHSEHSGHP